ncbi:phosphoribosylformylglycinamidine synthase [Anaerotardibacter muris]|uniref:phosphoribosylformylglycinamidine synthase n=1 Tax=Anaerotardibacter muris TaxID=2941505 RepID=UPI00203B47E9|nr:phosphoribosylformylglycinamidine synthase [Anaerotardibacter muris]
MVSRVYVEKKPGFDVEAQQLLHELRTILGINDLDNLRLLNRYDVEGITDDLFATCTPTVFSEPQSDTVYDQLPEAPGATVFGVEFLPGQFDQRADSASECIQLISQGERPEVRSARIFLLEGALTDEDISAIKNYVINPVEAREAALEKPSTLKMEFPTPEPVEVIDGFIDLDAAGLQQFIADRGLAMDLADIEFCQRYFASEKRNPTITEIKMIDTYWSDHCRHTTFGTELENLRIDDAQVREAFDNYLRMRSDLDRDSKPVTLMDMGTIGAKWLKDKGILKNLDESEEINACTVKVKVDVDGEEQDWLYLFKNETHNHPTEIEPFGGAATCVGGAIRDPLSGRSYVYQSMRVTGAADPLVPVDQTLPGKLPQRKLVTTAASGFSSYGNQIGLATGQVNELYHPGYAAKRMEIGAVVGATPAADVRRETPAPGDVIVLLGGRTGRDGIGGATGSSKAHNLESIETCGAEVQKGNAPVERKIQRLFRNSEASRMIKRCNDFGAGGVSVAIGELADGLQIDLDRVPKKYEGLDGTELAISESQERMAVALAPEDVDRFIELAHSENLEATPVATVTAEQRVRMTWNGDTIVDVSREFLASNGAPKHVEVHVEEGGEYLPEWPGNTLAERMMAVVTDLNVASNKGLSERFDSTIGAGTVLMPFGGEHQLTPSMAMAAKLPVDGETTTCSGMAWGFNPYLSEANQYEGAYLAVIESLAKLVAAGFERANAYYSFQEYFERLRDEPTRWGKPVASVLGALMAQVDTEVGSIGGKDSMSGSFEQLDVPPTLVSFATACGPIDRITSPEFKGAGNRVVFISPAYTEDGLLPDAQGFRDACSLVEDLIGSGKALAVSTPGYGSYAEALFKMCVGNRIGVQIDGTVNSAALFVPAYGSFIVELDADAQIPESSDVVEVIEAGITTAEYEFAVGDESVALADLQEAWEAKLESVFPYRTLENEEATAQDAAAAAVEDAEASSIEALSFTAEAPLVYCGSVAKPRVVIPVFPGNNCEYDSARAFERAGAAPTTLIVNNLNPQAVIESTKALAAAIRESQIVMIPGGFSGGDEPDGSAKFITSFFRAPEVTEAVRDLLQNRDGLMLGICNGFQALVKLGLVPYGDIREMDDTCPTLTFNSIGRHQSMLVDTRVASTLSPWLSLCEVGEIHTVAISHGEGRFVASPEMLEQLKANGQIATQYVDGAGDPSMDLAFNPNGSVWAIEGITSPDGRVFGKMGHSERSGEGLYKNVPGNLYQPIFEGGVHYFA